MNFWTILTSSLDWYIYFYHRKISIFLIYKILIISFGALSVFTIYTPCISNSNNLIYYAIIDNRDILKFFQLANETINKHRNHFQVISYQSDHR